LRRMRMPVHDWTRVEAGMFHDFHTKLGQGIHLLLVDLILSTRHDPRGMHGAIWERFDDEPYTLPGGEPLTLVSYVAGPRPEAWVEHLAVGAPLPEMPLFLDPGHYVNVPLEATYEAAWRGLPAIWREVLGRGGPLPHDEIRTGASSVAQRGSRSWPAPTRRVSSSCPSGASAMMPGTG
jgi:hypothetical protein